MTTMLKRNNVKHIFSDLNDDVYRRNNLTMQDNSPNNIRQGSKSAGECKDRSNEKILVSSRPRMEDSNDDDTRPPVMSSCRRKKAELAGCNASCPLSSLSTTECDSNKEGLETKKLANNKGITGSLRAVPSFFPATTVSASSSISSRSKHNSSSNDGRRQLLSGDRIVGEEFSSKEEHLNTRVNVNSSHHSLSRRRKKLVEGITDIGRNNNGIDIKETSRRPEEVLREEHEIPSRPTGYAERRQDAEKKLIEVPLYWQEKGKSTETDNRSRNLRARTRRDGNINATILKIMEKEDSGGMEDITPQEMFEKISSQSKTRRRYNKTLKSDVVPLGTTASSQSSKSEFRRRCQDIIQDISKTIVKEQKGSIETAQTKQNGGENGYRRYQKVDVVNKTVLAESISNGSNIDSKSNPCAKHIEPLSNGTGGGITTRTTTIVHNDFPSSRANLGNSLSHENDSNQHTPPTVVTIPYETVVGPEHHNYKTPPLSPVLLPDSPTYVLPVGNHDWLLVETKLARPGNDDEGSDRGREVLIDQLLKKAEKIVTFDEVTPKLVSKDSSKDTASIVSLTASSPDSDEPDRAIDSTTRRLDPKGYNSCSNSVEATNTIPHQAPTSLSIMSSLSSLSSCNDQSPAVSALVTSSTENTRLLRELEIATKKQKKLEKQLQQAGIHIAEDVDYETAKSEVQRIAKRMGEIGSADVADPALREEYYKLEKEMEKNQTALALTDEYIEEQEKNEKEWEKINKPLNREALHKLRRHMPVNIKSMTEQQLITGSTPNGKVLPRNIARKFKRTNVLQLLRTDPQDIIPMHPATIENMRVVGLTLTERRAIYAHLIDVGPKWKAMKADSMTERKWTWFNMMRDNFKSALEQYTIHIKRYGPPDNHPYAKLNDSLVGGCPMIGKQCPLRADAEIDYSGDYGYTTEDKYAESNVQRAGVDDSEKIRIETQALTRDNRAKDRSDALKDHYKGNVLQVSLANGSCESMGEALDAMESKLMEWIEKRITNHGGNGLEHVTDETKRREISSFNDALGELKLSVLKYAGRSGMQLSGKRDANDNKIDIRSSIEIGLCEDVIDFASKEFFVDIEDRMKCLGIKDKRMKATIDKLTNLMDELHERNIKTLQNELHRERPPPSRKHNTRVEMKKCIMKKLDQKGEDGGSNKVTQFSEERVPHGVEGRKDLMAAIASRGKGRRKNRDERGKHHAAAACGGVQGGFLAELKAKAATIK